jgi:PAS domain S-box-containing protein
MDPRVVKPGESTDGNPASPGPERDDRFRILVESIKDYAIFLLDANGRVLTWNAGAEIIKGYDRTEIVGQHIEIFYTPEDRERGHPAFLINKAIH